MISGAINGEAALTIRTTKRAADSRYAKIMEVVRESEEKRPRLRRLGDQLGAIYTTLQWQSRGQYSLGRLVVKPCGSWLSW